MTPAVKLMTSTSMAFRLCEYDHDPANSNFGLEAADLLGLDPDQVFKTLIVLVGEEEMCAVVPVSGQLSLKLFAQAVGAKRAKCALIGLSDRPGTWLEESRQLRSADA